MIAHHPFKHQLKTWAQQTLKALTAELDPKTAQMDRLKSMSASMSISKDRTSSGFSAEEFLKHLLISASSLQEVWGFLHQRVRSGSEPLFMLLCAVDERTHTLQPRFLSLHESPYTLDYTEISLHDQENHLVQTVFRKDTMFSDRFEKLGRWFNSLPPLQGVVLPEQCPIFTIPLIAGGRTVATLTIGFGELDTMTQAKLSFLYLIRDVLAQLIWNLLLQEKLYQQQPVCRDPLTGLADFNGFYQQLQRLQSEARQDKTPLTVMLVDVDRLLTLTQTYGLDRGNQVLLALRDVLLEQVGSAGVVARWGGDEFVVLLPNTDEAQAQEVGRRIEARFAQATTALGTSVTCHWSTASWPQEVMALHQLLPTVLRKLSLSASASGLESRENSAESVLVDRDLTTFEEAIAPSVVTEAS